VETHNKISYRERCGIIDGTVRVFNQICRRYDELYSNYIFYLPKGQHNDFIVEGIGLLYDQNNEKVTIGNAEFDIIILKCHD
jgi:hypothetical protein